MLRNLWLLLGVSHLTLAFLGSIGVKTVNWLWIGTSIEYYRILTGADRGFGFFAPQVIGEPIIKIEVTGLDGVTSVFDPAEGVSRETQLRISSAVGSMATYFKDPDIRQAISASIAGHVMSRAPVSKVAMIWEHHHVPTRKQYVAGKRPRREEIYRISFSHPSLPN